MPPSPAVTAEDLADLPVPTDLSLSPCGTRVVYVVAPRSRKGKENLSSLWVAYIHNNTTSSSTTATTHKPSTDSPAAASSSTGAPPIGAPSTKGPSARQLTSGQAHDRHPRICPATGATVAFLSDRANTADSHCAIYTLPLDAAGEAVPLSPLGCKRKISSLEWSPDGRFIAYLSADEKGGEEGEGEGRDDANVWGKGWERERVRVVHVATGTVEVVYKRERHVVGIAWEAGSKRIVCATLEDTRWDCGTESGVHFEVVSVAAAEEEPQLLYHHPASIYPPLAWGAKGVFFVSTVKFNNASAWALWRVDVGSGTASVEAYGQEDGADSVKAQKGIVCTKVLAGLSEELRILGGDTIYSDKREVTSWDVVANGDAGGYVVALIRSSVAQPPEVYSLTSSSKEAVQLSSHGSRITDAKLGVTHEISCRSYDDKVLLQGFYVSPTEQSSEKPQSTMVIVHGGPYWRQTNSFQAPHLPWMPAVLAAGKYGVLLPNYRGSSSWGEAHAAHVLEQSGTLEYDDVLALVDEGIKRGFVDPENVIVGGWSYGGLLSYLAAVRNGFTFAGEAKSWKFKGVIPGAGVSDWDAMAYTSDIPLFQANMAAMSPWHADSRHWTDGRKGSAIWELKMSRDRIPPVLLLHGEADDRVPVSQAWAFQRGCRCWKIPCEMVTYPREGHLIEERAHMIDMLRRVRKFCDLHLD